MNTAVQAKVAFQHILLGLAACASAHAQLPSSLLSGGYTGRSVSGTTVSIASLRVPEKAWRHFEKAKTLAAHNRSFESKVESRKAIAIAPRFTVAYLLCASAEVQEHDFQAALISISEAERVEPNAMWSHVLLASTYNGLRRYDDAEAVLNQVRGPEQNHGRQLTNMRAQRSVYVTRRVLNGGAKQQWHLHLGRLPTYTSYERTLLFWRNAGLRQPAKWNLICMPALRRLVTLKYSPLSSMPG